MPETMKEEPLWIVRFCYRNEWEISAIPGAAKGALAVFETRRDAFNWANRHASGELRLRLYAPDGSVTQEWARGERVAVTA